MSVSEPRLKHEEPEGRAARLGQPLGTVVDVECVPGELLIVYFRRAVGDVSCRSRVGSPAGAPASRVVGGELISQFTPKGEHRLGPDIEMGSRHIEVFARERLFYWAITKWRLPGM